MGSLGLILSPAARSGAGRRNGKVPNGGAIMDLKRNLEKSKVPKKKIQHQG